jgi:hypothetical protein
MFEISVHIVTEDRMPSTIAFRTSGLYICFYMLEILWSQDIMKMLLFTQILIYRLLEEQFEETKGII